MSSDRPATAVAQPPVVNVVPARQSVSVAVDWRTLLSAYSDWDIDTMMAIIACESHGDPNAVSPDGRNIGAFQENIVHGFVYADMIDPVRSTALAHDVWLSQGYGAWSCYR